MSWGCRPHANDRLNLHNDPRHHTVVAIADDGMIGSATGTHYVHPDQPPTLFIIEVAGARAYRRRGVAKAMMQALLAHGRSLGCTNAWVPGSAPRAPTSPLRRCTDQLAARSTRTPSSCSRST